jgi:hypothetical protein
LDGIEGEPALGLPGMAPISFGWSLVPFNADRPLPPTSWATGRRRQSVADQLASAAPGP